MGQTEKCKLKYTMMYTYLPMCTNTEDRKTNSVRYLEIKDLSFIAPCESVTLKKQY